MEIAQMGSLKSSMTLLKLIPIVVVGQIAVAVILSSLAQHIRNACYSGAISSEGEAVEAAKRLVLGHKIFTFAGGESAPEFVASLDHAEKCCGATPQFSSQYFSTVWLVGLDSKKYSTFLVIDGCGTKVLDRGILGN